MQKSIKFLDITSTTQGKENKQEVVRLIAASEKRQYETIQGELIFHTQTLMQQMQQMTELIQQKQKRPPTTPIKTRKYCPSKRVSCTCTSPKDYQVLVPVVPIVLIDSKKGIRC